MRSGAPDTEQLQTSEAFMHAMLNSCGRELWLRDDNTFNGRRIGLTYRRILVPPDSLGGYAFSQKNFLSGEFEGAARMRLSGRGFTPRSPLGEYEDVQAFLSARTAAEVN